MRNEIMDLIMIENINCFYFFDSIILFYIDVK